VSQLILTPSEQVRFQLILTPREHIHYLILTPSKQIHSADLYAERTYPFELNAEQRANKSV
jgi:hypothetical protein